MRKIILATTIIASTIGSAGAQTAPYEGRWAGGPATCSQPFEFTASRYTPPGGAQIRVSEVEKDGSNFLLSFPDGYRVALFDVGRRTMTWHSPISGDTFELERCR